MSDESNEKSKKKFVSLIEDPYGFSNLDVADAQNQAGELDLDEIPAETEEAAGLSETDEAAELSAADEVAEEAAEEASELAYTEVAPASLEAAADEWKADADEETLDASPASEESDSDSDDESLSESLDDSLDDSFDDTEIEEVDHIQLDRLAAAVANAEEELAAERASAAAADEPSEEVKAAELAAQIAEDEALQKKLAEEEAQANELDPELQAALPKAPEADESGELDLSEVESCLEALLFMTDKPVSVEKLRDLLGPEFSLGVFQEAMGRLMDRYQAVHHGIEIVQVANGYQLRTKPGRAALARKLAKVSVQRLSSGAMETLAIVAYRQPVMKEDIDKIRGVDSSYFVRGLLDRKLIKIAGRSDLPGRPMLYATSDEFLEIFGLKDLSAMPSLHEIEKMIPASQSANPDEEDPRVKEMRKLVGQMKSDTSTSLIYNARDDEKLLKEIRERVNSIPTSTPYLDQQKEIEKLTLALAQKGITAPANATPELLAALLAETAQPPVVEPTGAPQGELTLTTESEQQALAQAAAEQAALEAAQQMGDVPSETN